MRGMAYKRYQREKHIKRKEDLLRSFRLDNPPHKYDDEDLFSNLSSYCANEGWWFPYYIVHSRGQLNKASVHCNCRFLNFNYKTYNKTRNKGKRRHIQGNYNPSINYKPSDKRKIQKMNWDETNWDKEDDFLEKIFQTGLFAKDKTICTEDCFSWVSDEELEELINSIYT